MSRGKNKTQKGEYHKTSFSGGVFKILGSVSCYFHPPERFKFAPSRQSISKARFEALPSGTSELMEIEAGAMRKKLVVIFLCWVFLYQPVGSQSLSFHHIGLREGLSQGSVLAIAQDANGFIWMGTRFGLNRYNAHSFRTYTHHANDSTSISANYILALLKDSKGVLWVGTNVGLNRYHPKTDRFERIPTSTGSRIASLHEDRSGRIWVGTNNGIFIGTGTASQGFKKLQLPVGPGGLAGADIKAIYTDSKGYTWIGTTTGLTRIRFMNNQPKCESFFSTMAPGGLFSNFITTIAEDQEQRLWVGTSNAGLHKFEPATQQFSHFGHNSADANSIINNNIRKITVDHKGLLWIGTQEGLSTYNGFQNRFVNYQHDPEDPNSLSQNSIYDIHVDDAGNTWVGTYFGGANVVYAHNTPFYKQRYTRHFPSISNNVVSDFAEDADGNIWIGTEGGGLNCWNRNTGQFIAFKNQEENPSSLMSNLVKAVSIAKNGNIWIATHRGGLSMLDRRTRQFKNFRPTRGITNGLPTSEASAVLVDTRNRIWVGTDSNGLRIFDEQRQTFRNYLNDSSRPFQLTGNHVRYLYEDAEQNLWIATENGIDLLPAHGSEFANYMGIMHAPSIYIGTYNCVFRDNRNRLWLGSNTIGLVQTGPNPNNWQHLGKQAGLAGNNVYGILQDASGFLWISTENGISRFDIETNAIINYNMDDGLPSNEFNYMAFFKDSKGEMYFGGFNGFTHFRPNQIQANLRTRPVLITGLSLANNRITAGDSTGILQSDISHTRAIELSHTQNILTLEFSTLNYIKPQKTRYAWMLEGFDKTWQYSNQHTVTYTNLPPGKFTFLVKAANNDGQWYETPTRLKIRVNPPAWKTWWAYLLYTLLLAAIAFFVIRFVWLRDRFKREASMQQFKLDFFTNISHEIRTHLSLILGPVEQMLLNGNVDAVINKQLMHVRTNADRLMRLVSEMMDLRKAETNHLQLHVTKENLFLFLQDVFAACEGMARVKMITTSFENNCQQADLYFDKIQLEKVFFNLLTNAIKFTPVGGSIQLAATEDAENVYIKVIDNGIGISADHISKLFTTYFQVTDGDTKHAGYGIGLALAKSLVTLHNGRLTVDSKPATEYETGFTCFTVALKKGNAHFDSQALTPIPAVATTAAIDGFTEGGDEHSSALQVLLLVEDNAELRAFIKESLSGKYTLIETDNGTTGLLMAQEQIPDLVISDIMMPGMDGLTLCSTLKQDVRTSHIPILLLTAKASAKQQVEGLQTGADLYITKPFSIQLLELQIANLLASKAAMRKRYMHQVTLQPRNIEITNNDEAFLSNAIDIIDTHMDDEQFGVAMLSQKMAMSQPVLYKKLKALTDMSVNDFIKSIKLKKAAMLLLQKQLNVNEVAYRVGFNDRKYFSREFKKQFGKTPSEYVGAAKAE